MLEDYIGVVPGVTEYPAYNSTLVPGVKAITYTGATRFGKPTNVFAYIGYPQGAKPGDKLPAVILVHGGGGHAFSLWIKEWTDRGYVALAMDNTGYFPVNAGACFEANDWAFGMEGNPDFYVKGCANLPACDWFADAERPVEQQWMYYAVTDVILALNLLKADPAVEPAKVGIYGISWGSVITNLAMGYVKFAFAVAQYCSGFFRYSVSNRVVFGRTDFDKCPWIAEDRYGNVDFPVLFLQWTGDPSSSCNSNSMCYLATRQYSSFSLIMDWLHTHDWTRPEPYRFADCALKGKQALVRLSNEPQENRYYGVVFTVPEDAEQLSATVCYTKAPLAEVICGPKDEINKWHTVPATIDDNICHGILPEDAVVYYIDFTFTAGGKQYHTASAVTTVKNLK